MNFRIKIFTAAISILFSISFFNSFAQTDCRISGMVYDSSSLTPVSNVNVIIRGTKSGCTTDSNGYFQFKLVSGKEYTIVFSRIGYTKAVRKLKITSPVEVEYRIYLSENGIALPEVTVTGERRFARIPSFLSLNGDDLERLGQKNLEKALTYYFPRIIFPWWERETNEDKDFTLYVNGEYKETDYLDKIDPFRVQYIKIWKRNLSNATEAKLKKNWNDSNIEYTPNELPCRKGNYVVLIVTDEETTSGE